MRYYIIAGEASGDLHASNLMYELKKLDPEAEFRAWGGDLMQQAGAEIVKHYRELAFMGFTEVVMNLRTILKNITRCKNDISNYRPDVVILVDYPGFNLRIASFVKSLGIPVFYYISPQVWAWKQSRVKKIRESVDRMFVILPFEEEFYKKFGYKTDFVGHPLIDAIGGARKRFLPAAEWRRKNNLSDLPLIALLPGSRRQEISTMLPLMLDVIRDFPGYQFVVAAAPSVPRAFYDSMIGDLDATILEGETHELLYNAHAALVTSGTATLEAALFGVPEVVCYKGGRISYQIARWLVKVPFISLVNLIMEREIVKELIQDELYKENIRKELKKILDPETRAVMLKDYSELQDRLGGEGASAKAAALMISYLKKW